MTSRVSRVSSIFEFLATHPNPSTTLMDLNSFSYLLPKLLFETKMTKVFLKILLKKSSGSSFILGGYISFSDPFQISNPSQLFCNSSTLLKSFSKRKTFSKPSHYIQGGPSQSEYLLRSISNGVYVLLLKAILDFNTEKPSQIHLKSLSSDNLLKTISTHDLL